MNNSLLTQKGMAIGAFWSAVGFVQKKLKAGQKQVVSNEGTENSLNMRSEKGQNRYGYVSKLRNGHPVVIKRLSYRHKDLSYRHVLSEASVTGAIFNLLENRKAQISFKVPRLYKLSDRDNQLKMQLEYVDGVTLKNYPKQYKLDLIWRILRDLRLVSRKLDKDTISSFPKRGFSGMAISYPFFVLASLIKEPSLVWSYFKISAKFYFLLLVNGFQENYVISHRDLHSANILVRDNEACLLDFEMAALAGEYTDLAIVSRLYFKELGVRDVLELISRFVKNDASKRQFLLYSIFYTIQTLGIESKASVHYKDSLMFYKNMLSNHIFRNSFDKEALHLPRGVKSLTVGVPALNEVNNIGNLLNSIIRQDLDGIKLDQVLVVSDGSTDETVKVVRDFSKRFKFIKAVDGKSRKGKALRLNEIFKYNKSDLVLAIDGDTVLKDTDALQKLVNYFADDKVAIVSCNKQPTKAHNFVESVINAQFDYWYQVRRSINHGDNVYNTSSCAVALRGDFARKIRFPQGTILTSPFLYYSALMQGLNFRFAEDVNVLYRSPDNFRDYVKQMSRTSNDMEVNENVFGTTIHFYESIPLFTKISSLIKTFFKDPLYTPAVIVLNLIIARFFIRENKLGKKGLWETVTSSKKAITLAE